MSWCSCLSSSICLRSKHVALVLLLCSNLGHAAMYMYLVVLLVEHSVAVGAESPVGWQPQIHGEEDGMFHLVASQTGDSMPHAARRG